jgi:hypothetical protein
VKNIQTIEGRVRLSLEQPYLDFLEEKKETNMPATTTKDEIPKQTMPTAPYMSSLPQVQCLTTPVSVKRKTPTRRINIEEYANSSSETEEMPLDKTYRRVRLNKVSEVKSSKDGHPPPLSLPPRLHPTI